MVRLRLGEFLRRQTTALAALIVVITAVVFYKVGSYDFTSWDDLTNVVYNHCLQSVSLRTVSHFWLHPYFQLYIPLSYTVYALVGLMGRSATTQNSLTAFDTCLNPCVFHLANLFLHLLNVVLVFCIIRRAVKSDVPAAFGTLLFALHPLQVESVAWVSELRGLLGSALTLAAANVYLASDADERRPRTDMAAAILYVLSLLAKPSGVVMALVLLFWDVYYNKQDFRRTLFRLLPWFAFAAGDVLLTRQVQPVYYYTNLPIGSRCIVALDSFGFYINKLICPFGLAAEYGRTPHWLFTHHWEYSMAPLAVISILGCICLGRGNRQLILCGGIFLLFLLPVSGLVPFTYQYRSTVADRYAYLALMGPSLLLAFSVAEISLPSRRMVVQCVAGVIIGLLACRTEAQLSTWKNTKTVFINVIAVNPNDWLPYLQLGSEFLREKNFDASEAEYLKVRSLGYTDKYVWTCLGDALQGKMDYAEAALDYSKALALSPTFAPALYGRARCEAMANDPHDAIVDYQEAIKYLPPSSYADYELAVELYTVGRYKDASIEFARTVGNHPNYLPTYYLFALTYTKMGRPKLARDIANVALARCPNYSPVMPFVTDVAPVGTGQKITFPWIFRK